MASILSEPVIVFPPALLVEPFSNSAASEIALNLIDSLLKSSIQDWIKSSLRSDPSGAEIIAQASPFFASNAWLSSFVQAERQSVLDAALLLAVDQCSALTPTAAALPSSAVLSTPLDDKMSLCKLRRAGLLPGDVCNVPSSRRRGSAGRRGSEGLRSNNVIY